MQKKDFLQECEQFMVKIQTASKKESDFQTNAQQQLVCHFVNLKSTDIVF